MFLKVDRVVRLEVLSKRSGRSNQDAVSLVLILRRKKALFIVSNKKNEDSFLAILKSKFREHWLLRKTHHS